jgi:hypothetical protein
MFMPRIGSFDGKRHGPGFQHDRQNSGAGDVGRGLELKLKSRVVGLSKKLNLTTDNTDNTDLHGSKSSNVQQDYFRSL